MGRPRNTSNLSNQLNIVNTINSVPQKETTTSSFVSRLTGPLSRGYQTLMAASGHSNNNSPQPSLENNNNSVLQSSDSSSNSNKRAYPELSPMVKRRNAGPMMSQSKFRKINRNLRHEVVGSPEPGNNKVVEKIEEEKEE